MVKNRTIVSKVGPEVRIAGNFIGGVSFLPVNSTMTAGSLPITFQSFVGRTISKWI